MKNKKLFSLLFFIFILVSPNNILLSQEMWSEIGPSGGSIINLKSFPDNSQIMLCGVENGGLYKSINRGESWQLLLHYQINDITTLNHGISYVACNEGLFISKDFGQTWNKIIDYPTWQVIALPNGIVAADTMTINRVNSYHHPTWPPWLLSFDYGKIWKSWHGTSVNPLHAYLLDSGAKRGSLLFHSNGSVFRTENVHIFKSDSIDWNKWTQLDSTNNDYLTYIYFESTTASDSIFYGYSKFYDFHPLNVIWGGVFQSTDWCKSWKRISKALSVTAMEEENGQLFIGEEDGYLRLYNLYTNVEELLGYFGGEITAIDTETWENGELIVAMKSGIYKTKNYGKNWYKSDNGIHHTQILAVQVVPIDQSSERIVIAMNNGGVWISDDGGNSWQSVNKSIYILPGLLHKAISDPTILYGGGSKLYFSENAGETWNLIKNFPAMYYGFWGRAIDIDIDPQNPDHVITTYWDHSIDDLRGIIFANGYKVEKNEIVWESQLWGNSEYNLAFRAQFNTDSRFVWISYESESTLMAVDLESQTILHQIFLPENFSAQFWFVKENNIYLFNSDKSRFWQTDDLGKNWVLTDLELNDYTLFEDKNTFGEAGQLVFGPDHKTLFLIYPGNGVLFSEDEGQIWQSFNDGLASTVAYQIEFSSLNPEVAFLATNNGLYKSKILTNIENKNDDQPSPGHFRLFNNYPNPFNNSTTISYLITKPSLVTLKVYDMLGRDCQTLVDEFIYPGKYSVTFNAANLSSGIYIANLKAGNKNNTQKLLLIK